MAPEQAAGLPVDSRADIYAVGNILYEMLAGRPPFQAPAFGQLVVQIITQPPPPLPERLASGEAMPPALAELVLRCLAKEPEARPQRLEEVTTAPADAPWRSAGHACPRIDEEEIPTQRTPDEAGRVVAAPAPADAGGRHGRGDAGRGAHLERGAEAVAARPGPTVAAVVAPSPAAPAPVTLTVHSVPEGARVIRVDTGEALGITPLVKEIAARGGPAGASRGDWPGTFRWSAGAAGLARLSSRFLWPRRAGPAPRRRRRLRARR